MKKYKLTEETIDFCGRTLHRIKAVRNFGNVKAGDLGGFIEKESNLSHNDNAWVYGNACVSGDAEVSGNACVFGNARVSGNAEVSGDACVFGNAWVFGNAEVSGDACVFGNAEVSGDAWVFGNAEVFGNARVSGNAEVSCDADYLCFKGLGSENRNTTVCRCKDNHIQVSCGCFGGTLAEFEAEVKETHGDSKYAKEYLACIEVIKIHFEINEG